MSSRRFKDGFLFGLDGKDYQQVNRIPGFLTIRSEVILSDTQKKLKIEEIADYFLAYFLGSVFYGSVLGAFDAIDYYERVYLPSERKGTTLKSLYSIIPRLGAMLDASTAEKMGGLFPTDDVAGTVDRINQELAKRNIVAVKADYKV